MKVIFFGAGYCTKYIIPLYLKFKNYLYSQRRVKPEKFDKKFNLKRLNIKKFFENRDYYLNGTNFILNSILLLKMEI